MNNIRCYSELIQLRTFEERYKYLKLDGRIGRKTFGFDRYLNQVLYRSPDWKEIRSKIIVRDDGCDLGIKGREIYVRLTVHHMNPITIEDIERRDPIVFDPEYLISTHPHTHEAIHFGTFEQTPQLPIERRKGDTCLWLT